MREVCTAHSAHGTCPGTSPSGCPQPEHGAVAPLPALNPPLCLTLLCTRPPTPRRLPAAEPTPRVLALPSSVSWLLARPSALAEVSGLQDTPPPGDRSDLRMDTPHPCPSALPLEPLPALHPFLVAVPSPSSPLVTLSLLDSVPQLQSSPSYEHPGLGEQLRGDAPPKSGTQPGPASMPTAWDSCWAPSHLGAPRPSGPPSPQGKGSYSCVFMGSVTKHSHAALPAGRGHPPGSGLWVPKVPPVCGCWAGPALSRILCPHRCQPHPSLQHLHQVPGLAPHTPLAGGRDQATCVAMVPAGVPWPLPSPWLVQGQGVGDGEGGPEPPGQV